MHYFNSEKTSSVFSFGSLLFSLFVSGSFVCGGIVYSKIYLNEIIFSGWSSLCIAIACSALLAITLYQICKLAYKSLFHFNIDISMTNDGFFAYVSMNAAWFAKTTGLLALAWLPYLLLRFPGNVDPDTLWQLMQTHGLAAASNHHPWFDTLFFSAFWWLGDALGNHAISIFLYAVFQIALTAAALALVVIYLGFLGAPNQIQRCSQLFFALYPVIPLFAQTMAKDMLFAPVFVFYFLGYFEIYRTRARCLRCRAFCSYFALVCLLLMLTKKTGIYIIALCLLPLFFAVVREWAIRLILISIIPILLFVVWDKFLVPGWGVMDGSSAEMMSIPSQQVAFYLKLHSGELSDDEWRILNQVYESPDQLPAVYTPGRADATKQLWKDKSSFRAKTEFAKWYLCTALRHPKDFILSVMALTLPIYYPDTMSEGDESLLFYRDNLQGSDTGDPGLEATLISFSGGLASSVSYQDFSVGIYRYPIVRHVSEAFNELYLSTMGLLPTLFSKCLFSWWIPLFIIAYLIDKRCLSNLGLLVPIIVMLLTLMAGPIALPRYYVSFVYTAPLALSAMFLKRPTLS